MSGSVNSTFVFAASSSSVISCAHRDEHPATHRTVRETNNKIRRLSIMTKNLSKVAKHTDIQILICHFGRSRETRFPARTSQTPGSSTSLGMTRFGFPKNTYVQSLKQSHARRRRHPNDKVSSMPTRN